MSPNEGAKANPSYREVCTGTTGHVEVLNVELTEKGATEDMFEELMKFTFMFHDPYVIYFCCLTLRLRFVSSYQGVTFCSNFLSVVQHNCMSYSIVHFLKSQDHVESTRKRCGNAICFGDFLFGYETTGNCE